MMKRICEMIPYTIREGEEIIPQSLGVSPIHGKGTLDSIWNNNCMTQMHRTSSLRTSELENNGNSQT